MSFFASEGRELSELKTALRKSVSVFQKKERNERKEKEKMKRKFSIKPFFDSILSVVAFLCPRVTYEYDVLSVWIPFGALISMKRL